MFSIKTLPAVLVTASLAAAGCARTDSTKTTTETETKRVGTTEQSTTTTKVDSPAGETTLVTKSFVGTVTRFEPGRSIEVMTGEKETHSFDLDDEDVVASIDPRTAVGSKVQLVEEKPEDGVHKITVTIAPTA
jgi:hypothetical protein